MSTNVRSYGFIAVLEVPITRAEREDLCEKLCEENSILDIVYNGELVYVDYNKRKDYLFRETDVYGLWIGNMEQDPQDLVREAAKYGLVVHEPTIRPYNCVWYNGVDCPINDLTEVKFLDHI